MAPEVHLSQMNVPFARVAAVGRTPVRGKWAPAHRDWPQTKAVRAGPPGTGKPDAGRRARGFDYERVACRGLRSVAVARAYPPNARQVGRVHDEDAART